MKSLNIAVTAILIAFSSSSSAGLQIIDSHNGAWVSITNGNLPAANAIVSVENVPQVSSEFITNRHGRVFIPLPFNSSRSVKYKATTENGKVFSRFQFHGKAN